MEVNVSNMEVNGSNMEVYYSHMEVILEVIFNPNGSKFGSEFTSRMLVESFHRSGWNISTVDSGRGKS